MVEKIAISGTPYGMGEQQGKLVADKVKASLKLFNTSKKEESKKVKLYQEKMLGAMEKYFPDLIEELRGIAEGMDLSYEKVVYWNLFPEIRTWMKRKNEIGEACSNILFVDSKTGPLHAKTTDGGKEHQEMVKMMPYILQHIRPSSGYAMLNFALAGTVWSESGINEKGLSFGNSSLGLTKDCNLEHGISRNIIGRPLLQSCATVQEGIEFLSSYHLSVKGYSIVLIDATGEAAIIDKTPNHQGVRRPEKGALFCTNTAETKETASYANAGASSESMANCNPKKRFAFLSRKIYEEEIEHSFENLMSLLSSHDAGGAICRHGGKDISYTHWYYIYINREKVMYLGESNPCKRDYSKFEF